MSRQSPSGWQLLVVGVLVVQSCLPTGVPSAHAQAVPSAGQQPNLDASPWSDVTPPVWQPEQALPPEPPPIASTPAAAPRLPQGVYVLPLAAVGHEQRFADLPIGMLRTPGVPLIEAEAQLAVLAPDQAARLSPAGVAFTLTIAERTADAVAPAQAKDAWQLIFDYGQLNLPAYGASLRERLALYRGLGCQPADAGAVCRAFVALPGQNDAVAGRLSANLDPQALLARLQGGGNAPALAEPVTQSPEELAEGALQPDDGPSGEGADPTAANPPDAQGSRTAEGETAADWLQADLASGQPAVYVVATLSGSEQGDFAATPYDSSSDYQLSLAVGALQTSYAVPLPPAAGGLAPDVTLQYDSGSVDGMTLNKNNQPGWAGIGWHYEPGSITRRLKTCGLTQAPGDLCLTGDNYVLALNGVSSPLVKDASGLYHPQNDPRWKIQKLTNGPTGTRTPSKNTGW